MTAKQEENSASTKKYYFIFDFDGVLGDTWEGTVVGRQQINNEQHLSFAEVAELVKAKFFKKWDTNRNDTPSPERIAVVGDWIARHGEHVARHQKTGLFTEFVEVIRNYTDLAQMAVVSSGARVYLGPLCEKSGLPFTHVLTYEDHHSKEEKVEQVCREWGVPLEEVYYFTDTLSDVYELETILPKAHIIGVDWGFLGGEALMQELPKEQILWKPQDLFALFPLSATIK